MRTNRGSEAVGRRIQMGRLGFQITHINWKISRERRRNLHGKCDTQNTGLKNMLHDKVLY
jgi:hypothetical protein